MILGDKWTLFHFNGYKLKTLGTTALKVCAGIVECLLNLLAHHKIGISNSISIQYFDHFNLHLQTAIYSINKKGTIMNIC